MKKMIALLLLVVLSFTLLAGCGQKEEEIPDFDPYEVEGTGGAGSAGVSGTATAFNPYTGEYNMYTDRVGKRPIAVSVNNISVAWPQYGISQADIVYEIETEGGITRLMCIFSDTREVEMIGSVRSLRDQFMEIVYPYDALIVHIGTSIYADQAIAAHNYRTLDGGNVPATIWTESRPGYAIEHTKFTGGQAIENGIAAAGLTTDTTSSISVFNFSDPDAIVELTSGDAASVNFALSTNSSYDGDFRYDEATATYLKYQRGKAQMDEGNGEQLAFTNVFVIFADISLRNDGKLVEVDYSVGGKGYYFSNGKYEEITWEKGDFSSNFTFTDSNGDELVVNTGKSYVSVVDDDLENKLEIA